MAPPPRYNPDEIAHRLAALADERANNAMEGLYESENDAVLLDAFARGEVDRAELDRRLRADLRKKTRFYVPANTPFAYRLRWWHGDPEK